jgi:hypothetical protein
MRKDTWLMLVSTTSLLIAIVSLALVAWTIGELRQGITTRSLAVVTPAGRIRLGVLPGNVLGMQIYSSSGRQRLGLGVLPGKLAGFAVYDAAGKKRFHLMFFDPANRSELKIQRRK